MEVFADMRPSLVLVVRRGSDAACRSVALGMYGLHTAGESLLEEGARVEKDFRKPDVGKRADAAS